MNISYKLYQTKKQSRIIVRCQKKDLDISCALELFVDESCWDSELQLLANSPIVNEKLLELKKTILSEYNNSYVTGQILGKRWLQSIISSVFDRPNNEKKLANSDANIYLSAFANEWLKTDGKTWKISHNRVIGKTMLGQYQNAVDLLIKFEKSTKSKISMHNAPSGCLQEFSEYLVYELNYNGSTAHRILMRIKFFIARASDKGFKIPASFREKIYVEKDDDIDSVYLTEEEILRICKLDLLHDEKLDLIKDVFLLGIFTGMRYSDYGKRLDISNLKDGFIKIKTQKTNQRIVVPVHRVVAEIIKKRNGKLPSCSNLHEFNLGIRTICMICDIDELVYGKLFDSQIKRKKVGMYKKYQLISSHSTRRGFATLYADKLSESAICSILGWSNSQMIKIYNQTSKETYALQLKSIWDEQ